MINEFLLKFVCTYSRVSSKALHPLREGGDGGVLVGPATVHVHVVLSRGIKTKLNCSDLIASTRRGFRWWPHGRVISFHFLLLISKIWNYKGNFLCGGGGEINTMIKKITNIYYFMLEKTRSLAFLTVLKCGIHIPFTNNPLTSTKFRN